MSTRTRTKYAVATCAALATLGTGLMTASPASARASRDDTGLQRLISYDTAFVPVGAKARVLRTYTPAGGRSIIVLRVHGLLPNREYGAHAHKLPCGTADPLAAGPHFQYVPDPVQPSTDPAYANPDNEIWLDFTTDAEGDASARAVVEWQFPNAAGERAQSVIVHDHHTATPPGTAGTAGPRYGCLSVPF